jgi:hypothetical protein
MNELRALLIDCRIELRKLVRDFHKTKLSEQLDAALQSLAANPIELEAKGPPTAARAREIKETSNQVALAWQMAARDLKFSNPPLYDALSKKVMSRLETRTLVDQVDELHQLEANIADLHAQQAEAEKARLALEIERDTLLGALATAVPLLGDGGDRIGVALARIDWLKAQGLKAATSTALSTAHEEETRIPDDDILAVVAAGARQFTKAQREWCIGEAMVLSGFQYTPMELIEQGDSGIARIITEAKRGR